MGEGDQLTPQEGGKVVKFDCPNVKLIKFRRMMLLKIIEMRQAIIVGDKIRMRTVC